MKYYYRCIKSGGAYPGSSIEADPANLIELGTRDWTIGGVKALYVYFFGDANNAGSDANALMWVALDDGTNIGYATYPDGMADTHELEWHEWNIDLGIFGSNSVTLSNVTKVLLGFGGYPEATGKVLGPGAQPHGKGDTVYFEDFRLWPPTCFPEKTRGTGNFNDDCLINYLDLEIMGDEWLRTDGEALAQPPSFKPEVWYRFDEGPGATTIKNDGSWGSEYDLTISSPNTPNEPKWTSDVGPVAEPCDPNYALDFDGLDYDANGDYIEVPNYPDPNHFAGTQNMTITAWVKATIPQTNGYECLIASKQSTGGRHATGLGFGAQGDNLNYFWNEDYWQWKTTPDIQDSQWTFMAVAVEPTQATVYVYDGTTLETAINAAAHGPLEEFCTTCTTWIGSAVKAGNDHYDGILDDLRLYNKTLPVGDIMGLAGIVGKVYVPMIATTNIYPKSPPGAPYDPNNIDVINIKDYAIIADNWLDRVLWPSW
jgi:hypothetical protein